MLAVAFLALAAVIDQASLLGEWGGPLVRLRLEAAGGRLDAPCASARLSGPLTPDADGRFRLTAAYEAHRPGPQPAPDIGPIPATTPVQLSGRIEGNTMHITLQQQGAPMESWQLVKGRKARIFGCQ